MVPSPSLHVSTPHSLPSTISNHSWLLLLYRVIHTLHAYTVAVQLNLSNTCMYALETEGGVLISEPYCYNVYYGTANAVSSSLKCPHFRVV